MPRLASVFEFVAVVGDAAAGAAERERGPDDEREAADLVRDGAGFVQVVRGAGDGHVEADGQHQVLERLAVFAFVDGLGFGADHFDAVFFERAGFVQGHGGVERGLAAERGEQNELVRVLVWRRVLGTPIFHLLLLADDDFLHALRA